MIVPGASDQMGPGGYGTMDGPAITLVSKGLITAVPVGLTVISLVGVGKFLKAARVISAADVALVRLYQTGRVPWLGASTYYPPGWMGPALTMMGGTVSTWLTPDPSSGGGGPGEIPKLHRPPPSIEEVGEILSNPPIAGEVPSSPSSSNRPSSGSISGKRRKSCPPGYRWNGRRCVKKG